MNDCRLRTTIVIFDKDKWGRINLSLSECSCKMASFDELLCYYFSCKFTNVEMLGMLVKYNKCVMSLFTLKRYLERLGLRRCVPHGYENRDLVLNEVPKQLVGSASNLSNAFSSILPMFKKWIKETFTMVELKPCDLHFLCSYIDVLSNLEPVTQRCLSRFSYRQFHSVECF